MMQDLEILNVFHIQAKMFFIRKKNVALMNATFVQQSSCFGAFREDIGVGFKSC
jgi:hypothetical protein